MLSLGLAAGGPLQTLNKERGTDKKDSWTKGLLRRTVTCYLPRSDPQCHGSKIEEEADQGRGDEEEAVRCEHVTVKADQFEFIERCSSAGGDLTGTVAVTVTVAVAGRAYGCRRATRVGGGDTKQNQFFRSHPPSSRKKGFGVLWVKRGNVRFYNKDDLCPTCWLLGSERRVRGGASSSW